MQGRSRLMVDCLSKHGQILAFCKAEGANDINMPPQSGFVVSVRNGPILRVQHPLLLLKVSYSPVAVARSNFVSRSASVGSMQSLHSWAHFATTIHMVMKETVELTFIRQDIFSWWLRAALP